MYKNRKDKIVSISITAFGMTIFAISLTLSFIKGPLSKPLLMDDMPHKNNQQGQIMKTINIDIYPEHAERGSDWVDIADKLHEAQKMKKHFAALELKLQQDLKSLSEETSSKGGNYVYTCSYTKGTVDYRSIPQLERVDFEAFRKPEVAKWKLTKI